MHWVMKNKKSKVYLLRTPEKRDRDFVARAGSRLFAMSDLRQCFERGDLTAIKTHFGEGDNDTFISPEAIGALAGELKKLGSRPFLTETCTLYSGRRSDAPAHLELAFEHGFTIEKCGAPIVMADGVRGADEEDVTVNCPVLKTVHVARGIMQADSLLVASHVTGHIAAGFGAAIKNMGMGFASRRGKLRQHSSVKPFIDEDSCTACMRCAEHCPVDAIENMGDFARINGKICIGCAECLAVCRIGAVRFDWGKTSGDLQKTMAEYAYGAVKGRMQRAGYMNYAVRVTKQCNCMSDHEGIICPDVGILASRDPVALDQATMDVIEQAAGKSWNELSTQPNDPHIQLEHAQRIGLGSREYELVEI